MISEEPKNSSLHNVNYLGLNMIEPFRHSKRADYAGLLSFIKTKFDYDFYYTHDNSRIYVDDIHQLKHFVQSSLHVYVAEIDNDYAGCILLWKSVGGGKNRYYIKIKATTEEVAKNLVTVLLWNVKQEVYAKIRKDNQFLTVLRTKGFKFLGGRGVQILLSYKPRKEKDHGPIDYSRDT